MFSNYKHQVDGKFESQDKTEPLAMKDKGRAVKLKCRNGQIIGKIRILNLPENINGKIITIRKKLAEKSEVISEAERTNELAETEIVYSVIQPRLKKTFHSAENGIKNITANASRILANTQAKCKNNLSQTPVDANDRPAEKWINEGTQKCVTTLPWCEQKSNINGWMREVNCKSDQNKTIGITSPYITSINNGRKRKLVSSCTNSVKKLKPDDFMENNINEDILAERSGMQIDSNQKSAIVHPILLLDKSWKDQPCVLAQNQSTDALLAEKKDPMGIDVNLNYIGGTSKNIHSRKNSIFSKECDSTNRSTDALLPVKEASTHTNVTLSYIDVTSKNIYSQKSGIFSKECNSSIPAESNILKESDSMKEALKLVEYESARRFLSSEYLTFRREDMTKENEKDCNKQKDMADNLIILQKALNSVKDDTLKEKAFKALAKYIIDIDSFLPACPPELRSIKDSETQTPVFGQLHIKKFMSVSQDPPSIQKVETIGANLSNVNDANICNSLPISKILDSHKYKADVTEIIEKYLKGNTGANNVAAIFTESCPICLEYVKQLEKDFNDCNNYDEIGMLGIHRAVIENNERAVARHLMVLRACGQNVNVPTNYNRTSLELAVQYNASMEIIELLLNAGAEPTSTNIIHDSALIIASRKKIPRLMEQLVLRVMNTELLNKFDSFGFAPIHWCACNGFVDGLMALIRGLANVNLCDLRSGRTPLFHSIENKHNNIAQILIENGANPNIPNYSGENIFDILDKSKHRDILELFN